MNELGGCLTAIVGSNAFVVAHLKGVEDGRDVDVADAGAGTAAGTEGRRVISGQYCKHFPQSLHLVRLVRFYCHLTR